MGNKPSIIVEEESTNDEDEEEQVYKILQLGTSMLFCHSFSG